MQSKKWICPVPFSRSVFIFFIVYLLLAVSAVYPSTNDLRIEKQVLILHSYHPDYVWTESIILGMKRVFLQSDLPLKIDSEYMDVKKYTSALHISNFQMLLATKIAGKNYDVILVSDDEALKYVISHTNNWFKDIPIVFCGINDVKSAVKTKSALMTGVGEEASIEATLDLALKLHPNVRDIAVIGRTNTLTERINQERFAIVSKKYSDKYEFVYWDNYTPKQLEQALKQLPEKSLVMVIGLVQSESGRALYPADTMKAIYTYCRVPIYSLWSFFLGEGIVGGKLIVGEEHGKIAAQIAIRILKGEKPQNIPIVTAEANRYMFDYYELSRFGIAIDQLPDTSTIINRTDNLVEHYQPLVVSGIVLMILMLIIIGFLLISLQAQKRNDIAIRQNEERLKAIFRASPDGISIIDLNGSILFESESGLKMFGLKDFESVKGKSVFHFIDESDKARAKQLFAEKLQGNRNGLSSYKGVRSDGSTFYFEPSAEYIYDTNGKIDGMVVLKRDVTVRIESENKLREKTGEFDMLFDQSVDMMIISGPDGIERVNPQWKNRMGYMPDEMIGKAVFSFIHPDDVVISRNAMNNISSSKNSVFLVNRFRTKNGDYRYLEWQAYARGIRIYASVRDVTDQMQVEAAIRLERDRMKEYISLIGVVLLVLDKQMGVRLLNRRGCELIGIGENEARDYDWMNKAVVSQDRSRITGMYRQLLRGNKKDAEAFEYRIHCANGEERLIAWHNTTLKNADNENELILASGEDITDKIKIERRLWENEQKFQAVLDNTSTLIFIKDLDGRYIVTNSAFQKIAGLDAADIIGKTDIELFPNAAEGLYINDHTVKTENRQISSEERVGERVYLSVKFPLRDPDGVPNAICGISTDISEIKKAQEKLEIIQALLLAAIAQTPAGIIIAEAPNVHISFVNQEAKRIVLTPEEQSLSISLDQPETIHWSCVRPDGSIYSIDELPLVEAITKEKSVQNVEMMIRRSDGSERWVLLNSATVRDQSGKVIAGIIVFPDITDAKQAHERLVISEERLNYAIIATNDALWDWNIRKGEYYFSPRWYTMLGYNPYEFNATFETWEQLLHPDDKEFTLKSIRDYIEGISERYEIECRMKTKPDPFVIRDEWLWILVRGKIVERDVNGKPTRLVGTHIDISKQKASGELLRISEERFRMVYENSGIGIVVSTANGAVLMSNPQFCKMIGYQEIELMDMRLSDMIQPSERDEEERKDFAQAVAEQQTFYWNEKVFVRKDQSIFWGRSHLSIGYDTEGKIDLVTAMVEDITLQKDAEISLRESEGRFRMLYYSMNEGVALHELICDGNGNAVNYRITDINPNYEKILNLKKENVVGKDANELYNTQEPPYLDTFAATAKDGISRHMETYFSPMDKYFVISIVSPEKDKFATIFWDVTENVKNMKRIEHLNSVLMSIRLIDQLITKEKNRENLIGGICSNLINNRGYRTAWIILLKEDFSILTYSQAGLGDKFQEIVDKYNRSEHIACIRHCLKNGEDVFIRRKTEKCGDCPIKIESEFGKYSVALMYQSRLYGILTVSVPSGFAESEEEEQLFAEIGNDISYALYSIEQEEIRKAVEKERLRLMDTILLKNSELEQIIYVTSHDLRSPLVNIQGFGKELEKGLGDLHKELVHLKIEDAIIEAILSKDIGVSLSFILKSAMKMDTLLAGLLKLSRMGRAALNIEKLDMNALMKIVLDSAEYLIHETGTEVTVEDLPGCMGDESQIIQVFSNLLDNAIKYRDAFRASKIHITGAVVGDDAVYCFEDNGIGIAKEYQTKIFEIFHRLSPDSTPGEGLGLNIVKKALDRNAGRIWIESTSDEGSRFFVALPKH